jgi:hypothetical protein
MFTIAFDSEIVFSYIARLRLKILDNPSHTPARVNRTDDLCLVVCFHIRQSTSAIRKTFVTLTEHCAGGLCVWLSIIPACTIKEDFNLTGELIVDSFSLPAVSFHLHRFSSSTFCLFILRRVYCIIIRRRALYTFGERGLQLT